jgi:hypothetical protein
MYDAADFEMAHPSQRSRWALADPHRHTDLADPPNSCAALVLRSTRLQPWTLRCAAVSYRPPGMAAAPGQPAQQQRAIGGGGSGHGSSSSAATSRMHTHLLDQQHSSRSSSASQAGSSSSSSSSSRTPASQQWSKGPARQHPGNPQQSPNTPADTQVHVCALCTAGALCYPHVAGGKSAAVTKRCPAGFSMEGDS